MKQGQLQVAGIVAAAGLSTRMGEFKPLLPYASHTMIQSTVESLKNAGVQHIIVVVGYRGAEIAGRLTGMEDVKVIYNPNYQQGDMLESIQLGLQALEEGWDAVYVLPGDMPAIATETFQRVRTGMEGTDGWVVFPTLNGRKKHPPLIARHCFSSICRFSGDGGLRMALQQFDKQTVYIPVDDVGCSIDVDTPADYAQLLQYRDHKNPINNT